MKITDFIDEVYNLNYILIDDSVPFSILIYFNEPYLDIFRKLKVRATPVNITPEDSVVFFKNSAQNLPKENFKKIDELTFYSLLIQINDRHKRSIVQEYIDRIFDICSEYNLKLKLIKNKNIGFNTNISIEN